MQTCDPINQSVNQQAVAPCGVTCCLAWWSKSVSFEPLAATIHQNMLIKGIRTEKIHHKINLYANLAISAGSLKHI